MKILKVFTILACLLSTEISLAQVQFGSLVDNRDKHTYRTIKIGNQVWMADNLAFQAEESYPPDGDIKNIPQYGLLYTWKAAQNVCPVGWHLPTQKEFQLLLQTACGNCETNEFGTYLCKNQCTMDILNKHGFMVLTAGYRWPVDGYSDFGSTASFWTSTKIDDEHTYDMDTASNSTIISRSHPNGALSVRCLKNSK